MDSKKRLLLDFFSYYLEEKELLSLLNKSQFITAWTSVFAGYSEEEMRAITQEIFSDYISLPRINQVKKYCTENYDVIKYQQEWELIIENTKTSDRHEVISDRLQKELSNPARLALKAVGGFSQIKDFTKPEYLPKTQDKFLEWCKKYKVQLKHKLVEPLPMTEYHFQTPKQEPPMTLAERAIGATMARFLYLCQQMKQAPSPEEIKQAYRFIEATWNNWEEKTPEILNRFKQHCLKELTKDAIAREEAYDF